MKITFLLTQSLESPSGLGRYWPVAKELRRQGHEVTILALHHDFRALVERRFTREGVHVWYVGQMHVRKVGSDKFYFKPLARLWVVARATLALLWAALRVPTDVYHVGKSHPMNSIAGIIASRLRNKPLYLDCDDYEAGSNYFSKPIQQQVVAYFENHIPKWAQGITVNTHFMANRLKKLEYPDEKVIYIPNGVDRERFSKVNVNQVNALRKRLGLEDYKVVLYMGSMSLCSHAVDLLLEAFQIVIASQSNVQLLLVGGGEDLGKLQEQAQQLGITNNTHFIGRIAPEEVPLYYCLADVAVDPVRNDPAAKGRSPLKMFESWASGVPFVTADVGDRRFLFGTPPAGILPSICSSAAIANAILLLLHDSHIQKTVSALGEERVKAFFWDVLVHRFMEVYNV